MRADRLIAELMLLQTQGKMSAAELSKEMEVSQRTIYRDMLALNTAGIPIYAENGSNGGYQLVDGYRTQLTGFNTGELQALFAMNIPAILGELGMDSEAKTAMRKLQASLSQQQSKDSVFMAQRFLYDPASWEDTSNKSGANAVLNLLQKAIWEDCIVEITIQYWFRPGQVQMRIAPYALVLNSNQWYLVFLRNDSFRIHNISNIISVTSNNVHFNRAEGFNLAEVWARWHKSQQKQRGHYQVMLLVKESANQAFTVNLGSNIIGVESPEAGWYPVKCAFDRFEEARSKLLSWGGSIRILEPEPLRLSMIDFAKQLIKINAVDT
jgi:predicted DNA-binding transcriptional regulator YafY